jgi:hypothetical protein
MLDLSSERRSNAARPAGVTSPCSSRTVIRLMLMLLQMLRARRGVKRMV